MAEINWGLAVPPNTSQTIVGGFKNGYAMAQEHKVNNALAQYATNPNDPTAVNALIKVDPRLGMQAKQQQQMQALAQRKLQDDTRKRQLIPLAAKGDQNAQLELMGIDPEVAMKLDDNSKKSALDAAKYVSEAAFDIIQRPPEQRAAAWDAYIKQGEQQFPHLAQFEGKYTPEALQSLVAQAGQMKEWQTFQQPHYTPVGEGGLAGFQFGQPMQQGGQPQNFAPAQSAPAGHPQPGSVVNGYTFKGGDPKDRNNWTQGGQTGAPSATFQPSPSGHVGFSGVPGETVTSTYRTPAHNKEVGGVGNSYHMRRYPDGSPMARDSVPPRGMSMSAYAAQLRQANPHLDVINEGDHIHLEPKG